MIVYNYDDDGHYAGPSNAQPNPRQSGQFLMPSNSTTEEPPAAGANNVQKWDGSSWNEVEDPIYTASQAQAAADADAQAEADDAAELAEINSYGVLLKELDGDDVVARDQSTIDAETDTAAWSALRGERNIKLFSARIIFGISLAPLATRAI